MDLAGRRSPNRAFHELDDLGAAYYYWVIK
jgi:hypothetical protein